MHIACWIRMRVDAQNEWTLSRDPHSFDSIWLCVWCFMYCIRGNGIAIGKLRYDRMKRQRTNEKLFVSCFFLLPFLLLFYRSIFNEENISSWKSCSNRTHFHTLHSHTNTLKDSMELPGSIIHSSINRLIRVVMRILCHTLITFNGKYKIKMRTEAFHMADVISKGKINHTLTQKYSSIHSKCVYVWKASFGFSFIFSFE